MYSCETDTLPGIFYQLHRGIQQDVTKRDSQRGPHKGAEEREGEHEQGGMEQSAANQGFEVAAGVARWLHLQRNKTCQVAEVEDKPGPQHSSRQKSFPPTCQPRCLCRASGCRPD